MNYSLTLKKELIENPPRRACCKRAYAAGLLFDVREWRNGCLVLVLSSAAARRECARVYREQYRREALTDGSVMLFSSEKLFAAYRDLPVFSCPHCQKYFFAGLFLSCGSMTDPEKGYHLEFRIANAEKIPVLSDLFKGADLDMKCRRIDFGAGFYCKKRSEIEKFIYLIGADNALFALLNAQIQRGIRNEENRATNCIAHNIGKTVSAATKVLSSIETIRSAGKFSLLPEELRETAKLREENPSVSLVELAALHNPPITKSGLNHRLQKILRFAEDLKTSKGTS